MKGLLILIASIFPITAIITHIWTVIIAFTEGGFWAGVISTILPFLSELYWIFQMLGENNTYAYIAIAHIVLAIPVSLVSSR